MSAPRDRLIAFYTQHNPQQLGQVDAILQRYAGREDELFAELEAHYNAGASGSTPAPVAGGEFTVEYPPGPLGLSFRREGSGADVKLVVGVSQGFTASQGVLVGDQMVAVGDTPIMGHDDVQYVTGLIKGSPRPMRITFRRAAPEPSAPPAASNPFTGAAGAAAAPASPSNPFTGASAAAPAAAEAMPSWATSDAATPTPTPGGPSSPPAAPPAAAPAPAAAAAPAGAAAAGAGMLDEHLDTTSHPDSVQGRSRYVIGRLQEIYERRVKPLEQVSDFWGFHAPPMAAGEFSTKPLLMLVGQYSVGKTTFIRHLLGRDFPGSRIGPEPTTDRFTAVFSGDDDADRVIPGHALAVHENLPFKGTQRFGNGFMSHFEGSQCNAPLLQQLTMIDTPGVLSGEKQRLGRQYDFVTVAEHFAGLSDVIILLFDAHKLDISDEFKEVLTALWRAGHGDKIRIVLNKADAHSAQTLMRVYGALMWSLGKVLQTPEVCRVYLGSFWDQPLHNTENARLFEAEERDLMTDLLNMPIQAAVRKLNELVKRIRLVKVHAHVMGHIANELPTMWGHSKKLQEIADSMPAVFRAVHQSSRLPPGDFPPPGPMSEKLRHYDYRKVKKLNEKLLSKLERTLEQELPELTEHLPSTTQVNM